jgi:hypothetical protein
MIQQVKFKFQEENIELKSKLNSLNDTHEILKREHKKEV